MSNLEISYITEWVITGVVIVFALVLMIFSVKKLLLHDDKVLLKNTLEKYLYHIFSVVECVFDGEKTGPAKFAAAKKLIIQNNLLPKHIQKIVDTKEFDQNVAQFIEEKLIKAQKIWSKGNQHKSVDK